MSELINTINNFRPNWTYSLDDGSEADVKVINHTGSSIPDTVMELVESTKGLVIALVGEGCISECPRDFTLFSVREAFADITELVEALPFRDALSTGHMGESAAPVLAPLRCRQQYAAPDR